MFSAGTFVDEYTSNTKSAFPRYASQLTLPACPTAGSEEPTEAEFMRRLGTIIPEAEVVEISGADHFSRGWVDALGAVLAEWLARVARTA